MDGPVWGSGRMRRVGVAQAMLRLLRPPLPPRPPPPAPPVRGPVCAAC